MIVRPVLSAVALLLALTCVALPAAAEQEKASKSGAPDQIASITKKAFDEMLTASVEDERSVKLEQGTTLRVELAAEEKVLFFTRPGHPAHPGVVEVRLIEQDGEPSLGTLGWWAGDAEAYRDWYGAFKRRNARLSREWQQESGPF